MPWPVLPCMAGLPLLLATCCGRSLSDTVRLPVACRRALPSPCATANSGRSRLDVPHRYVSGRHDVVYFTQSRHTSAIHPHLRPYIYACYQSVSLHLCLQTPSRDPLKMLCVVGIASSSRLLLPPVQSCTRRDRHVY